MPITVTPLSPLFGATVEGVDPSAPVPPDVADALRRALSLHKVLRIPAPQAGAEGFLRVARAMGALEPFFLSSYSHAEHPEIYVLSNVREQGKPIGRDGAGFHWHSDHTFETEPCSSTLLYGKECPAEGGDTLFVDTAAAWRSLPDALKQAADGRRAVHVYRKAEFAFTAEQDADPDRAAKIAALKARHAAESTASATAKASGTRPPVAHPLVRRHPVTGEPALYLNEEMMTGVEGMAEEDGRALLRALIDHATRPEGILRYRWRTGDIVVWDNASTLHAATFTDPAHRRIMYRLTLRGTAPV